MHKDKIYCPCCESELVQTHEGRYETLSEHVSDPNGTPSMKKAYSCPNEYCIANNLKGSWLRDGEFFMDPPEGVKWTVAHRAIEAASKTGRYDALNSWQDYYNGGKAKQKDWRFKIPIFKYRFEFEPRDKGSKFPDDQQYYPAWWKWTCKVWKKSDSCKGCYTYVRTFQGPILAYQTWKYRRKRRK